MRPSLQSLRGAYLTARRVGARRVLRRLERVLRLRTVDPHLGCYLYQLPGVSELPVADRGLRRLLAYLARIRGQAPLAGAWDRQDETVTLLNQPPFSLEVPVNWLDQPVADPLWAFRLHSWEWAWPFLASPSSRQTLLSLCHDWIASVAVGRGLAWEPYPTSRRLVVWAAAWHLLEGDKRLASAIARDASFLTDHLEQDLDNNHLVANAKALAWVGLLFPKLPQAQACRQMGLELLWGALDAQVRGDGGHVENSTSYHLAVWLDGLETALLCELCGEAVPETAWRTMELIGDYALALIRPDGRLPMLNDSVRDEPVPAQAVFSLAAMALARPDFLWHAGERGVSMDSLRSRVLEDTGYVVWRSGPDWSDTYLVFDAGDLGARHCVGHGHADTLSFELWARGEPLILDPGTYQYPAGCWRDYFRGTAAHSTATVDGMNQSGFAGPFRVTHLARARLLTATLDGPAPEIIGEHDGFTRLPDPVIHRRRICLRGRSLLEITDCFTGERAHDVILRFHLAPSEVDLLGPNVARVAYPGGSKLQLEFKGAAQGALKLEAGWTSRNWYSKEASPVLAYVFGEVAPITVRTVLRLS